jgi:hypothetical protein
MYITNKFFIFTKYKNAYIAKSLIISANIMMRELARKDFLYIKIIKESVFG